MRTLGELKEFATFIRNLGAAGFKLGDCEVQFFEPLAPEVIVREEKQRVEGFAETEDPQARLLRARRAQLDADIHGSA